MRKPWAGAVVAAAMIALLGGCATEFHNPRDRGPSQEDPRPAPEVPEPDPVSFDVGDCLRVDAEGVGPRFELRVDCAEFHEAQVFMVRTVTEERSLAAIAQQCKSSLRSAYREASEGAAHAVTSPANYVYNQGPVRAGDEVFCVFVHREPRSGGATLTDAPAREAAAEEEG